MPLHCYYINKKEAETTDFLVDDSMNQTNDKYGYHFQCDHYIVTDRTFIFVVDNNNSGVFIAVGVFVEEENKMDNDAVLY